MANIKPSTRLKFASRKSLNASVWLLTSGVATMALLEIAKVLGQLQLPQWVGLLSMAIINILVFAVAKYNEGTDK